MRLCLAIATLCFALSQTAHAQVTDFTWVGGNDGDIFNSAANWDNGAVTGDIGGANLIFDSTAASLKPIIDSNVTNIGGITFNPTNNFSLTPVSGFSLNVADGATIANNGPAFASFSAPIIAAGSLDITGDGDFFFKEAVTLNGTLTVNTSDIDIEFSGPLAGTGDMVFDGLASVTLQASSSGASTRTGDTTFNDGSFNVLSSTLGEGIDVLPDDGVLSVNGSTVGQLQNSETIGALSGDSANATFQYIYTTTLTIGGTGDGVGVGTGQSFTYNGEFSQIGSKGTSQLIVDIGSDMLTLNGPNTIPGKTILKSGTLTLGNDAALGTGTFTIDGTVIAGGAARTIDNPLAFSKDAGFDGVATFAGTNDLTFTGKGSIPKFGVTFDVTNTGLTDFQGALSGGSSDDLTKTGAGTLTLSAKNSYTGKTIVNEGTLDLQGEIAGVLDVNDGGTLIGSGTANGTTNINDGGSISPGNSIGTLTLNDFNLNDGATYFVELDRNAAKFTSDTISSFGDAVLAGGSTISISNLGDPIVDGDKFTILSAFGKNGITDGGVNLVSQIANTTFSLNSFTNGNTSLSVIASVIDVLIFKPLVDANWSTKGNWDPNRPELDADDGTLSFEGAGGSAVADGGDYTNIGNLQFNNTTDSYTLSGGSLTFSDDAAITNNSDDNHTIENDIVAPNSGLDIAANTADLAFTGAIDIGGSPLTVYGDSDTDISGPISGAGDLIKDDLGALTLSGTNTYAGQTIARDGTLIIGNDNALGTGTFAPGGTIIAGGGSRTIVNPILSSGDSGFDGSPTFAGANDLTFTGKVTIDKGGGDFNVTNTADTTFTGDISGTALTKTGAGSLTLSGNNTHAGTVLNDGTLNVASDTALSASTFKFHGGTLQVSGTTDRTIANDISIVDPGGTIDVTNTALTDFQGIISGGPSDNLTKTGAGTLTLSANNTYTGDTIVNAGTLDLQGSIPGDLDVNDGGTLMGIGFANGTTNINSGGNVRPGNSIGTLNFKYFNLNTGANLFVEVDRNAASTSDVIKAAGDVTLAKDSNINVTNLGDPLKVGDKFNVIDADGTLTDNGAVVEAGQITFESNIFSNFYQLIVKSTGSFTEKTRDSENARLGPALDKFRDNNPTSPLITTLQNLSDDQLDTFVRQVNEGSRVPDVLVNVSIETTQAFNNLLSQYLSSARNGTRNLAMQYGNSQGGTQLASLDLNPQVLGYAIAAMYAREDEAAAQSNAYQPLLPARTTEWSVYAKAYGITSNQNGTSNRTGYDSNSYGFQAGIDRQFGDNWIAGFTAGYTNTDANLDGGVGSLDVDSLRVGPYATYSADGGRWYIDIAATYGYHDTDGNRLATGTNADADYNSHDMTLYVGTGYNFSPTTNLRVTPIASLQYQYFYREDYTESGTGAIAFEDSDTNTLYSRIGIQLGYRFDVGSITLVPEVTVGWEHEWFQENETVDASFVGGGAFGIDSTAPESDSIFFGAGVTARLSETTSLFAKYQGTQNNTGNTHGLTAGLRFWY